MLFKQCKRTDKCLFAAGFGMQLLIYYCSTNFTEIDVINGGEKGGALTNIKDVPAKQLANLERY